MLNRLIGLSPWNLLRLLDKGVPFPEKGRQGTDDARQGRPLLEDYASRGFSFSDRYFAVKWFYIKEKIDDDEKYFDVPSMAEQRRKRVVWLGGRMAKSRAWLRVKNVKGKGKRFTVNPEYGVDGGDLEVGQFPLTPIDGVDCGELPDTSTV
jgi:hypothetical protein